jgi:N-carbamoyl-L-amino-acid hydrolase
VKWFLEIECKVAVDEVGNIFGYRPGKDNSLASVMSGSHIDFQPQAGGF